MKLYNTLTRTIEPFTPLHPPAVSFYACGPTVYDFTHIGHIRTYVYNDTLRRLLDAHGYQTKHVMNVTDVGHLAGDDDSGEDKMEKGARKYGKTVWDLASYYTDFFFMTTDAMNIHRPHTVSKATDHIPDMIEMVSTLLKAGNAYETAEAIYFDITTFPAYGKLSGQKMEDKLKGVRDEVYVDPQKKHPADFALWFKRVGRFADHSMHWDSPWGDGFPGWHIECSAMSNRYLGATIDIHTGGIDHIPVHHENEIAQSECANKAQFVRYWIHFSHLMVDGQKMSKSLGNFFTIEDVRSKGFAPAALRLLFLQSHYRTPANFTWSSLAAAQEAYTKLIAQLRTKISSDTTPLQSDAAKTLYTHCLSALDADLQSPQALPFMFEAVRSSLPAPELLWLFSRLDDLFGLDLINASQKQLADESIPEAVQELAQQRMQAKKEKNFEKADTIRTQIDQQGYMVEDIPTGFRIKKKP